MTSFRTMGDFWSYVARFTNYEKRTDYKADRRTFSLDRMRSLVERAGCPQDGPTYLHVAGTNGKGTTAYLASKILARAGLRVGLYQSPHLVDVRERIQVDGRPVAPGEWLEGMEGLAPHVEAPHPDGMPTFFEIVTALALQIFRRREVDVAVLEVGLGGRLDATNIVLPAGVAITELSFDHMTQLGDTIERIAGEKAAILKPGIPAVTGVSDPAALAVVRRKAAEVGSPLHLHGEDLLVDPVETIPRVGTTFHLRSWIRGYSLLHLPMPGLHFLRDAALAVGLCELLKESGKVDFSSAHLRPALAEAAFPGRCQLVERDPLVLLDGAHNPGAAAALSLALGSHFPGLSPVLFLAILEDKDVPGFLRALPAHARLFITQAESPRAMPAEKLSQLARSEGRLVAEASPDALGLFDRARSSLCDGEVLVVTGSFYLVGQILRERYPHASPGA